MNRHLQSILDFIQQYNNLSADEKNAILRSLKDADNEFEITTFKLDRTEKVKRTTAILLEETIAELEQKRKAVETQNRELEIESALERVRTVAMGMNKPDDMLDVCRVISGQLELLKVKEIRNVQTAIFYEAKGTYMNYEYYAKHDRTFITETSYTNHEIHQAFADQMLKGKGEFFERHINSIELPGWIAYQKTTNVFLDTFLETAASLNYYWYSLGPVALGISTYIPLSDEAMNLFKRFVKVFELAYRRFLDIEQAEAQAREAQIELGLERVRARAMAMHSSEELNLLAGTLFTELTRLDFNLIRCVIVIIYPATGASRWFMANPEDLLNPIDRFVKYHENPGYLAVLNAWKERIPNWVYINEGQLKKEWGEFLFSETELSSLPDSVKAGMSANERVFLNFSFGSFGGLLLSTVEPLPVENGDILQRFAKVFEQTYTRFLDLQKAEAQAREAQIELALERIRARTMAMQRSDELGDAALLMFQQVQALGAPTWTCGFFIWDDDMKATTAWMGSGQGILSPFKVASNEHIFLRFYEAAQRGESLHVLELKGEAMEAHYRYMSKVPAAGERLANLRASGAALPSTQIVHAAYFAHGYLLFITLKPVPGLWDIFKRFAKVFEQTYTRFLDLQKAEAQAREAQVQLALERVRARTMAMHTSDELSETAVLLYEQLRQLENIPARINIGIVNDKENIIEWWITGQGGTQIDTKFTTKTTGPSFLTKIYACWKEQKRSIVIDASGKELSDWFTYLRREMGDNLNEGLITDRMVSTVASFTNGIITITTPEPTSKETTSVLERFAGVFNLTYRRFLDLQKAEAQAREAQVEAALERVRAKTMAMYRSEQLAETAKVFFEQFDLLGNIPDRMSIGIINEESKKVELWITDQSGNQVNHEFFFSINERTSIAKIYAAWKEQKDTIIIDLTGQDLKDWLQFVRHEAKVPIDETRIKGRRVQQAAFFSSGFLLFTTHEPVADEIMQLLVRFARVFDLTYTRFLDLKKSEAQTREAQIQLALERVRARTMAMQKSEELSETAHIVFQQFKELGENPVQITIGIFNEEKRVIEFRITGFDGSGSKIEQAYNMDIDEPVLLHKVYTAWKEQKSSVVIEVSGKDLRKWTAYRNEIGGITKSPSDISEDDRRFVSVGFFSKGMISFSKREPISDETIKILERFANVFDLTYTRFLDLKQAEAQARAVQIQLSLERVRSRAMAMHRSDELSEVLTILFEQYDELAICPVYADLSIFDLPSNTFTWRCTGKEGQRIIAEQVIDIGSIDTWQDAVEKWRSGKTNEVHTLFFPKERLPQVFELFGEIRSKIPKDAIFTEEDLPDGLYTTEGFCKYGALGFGHNRKATEEEKTIVAKFATEFERLYTRFLDLQRAEAQAREAQIEVSLERVRARTMAMQRSDDLYHVINVVNEQLQQLGFQFDGANFATDFTQKGYNLWLATPGQSFPEQMYVPRLEYQAFRQLDEAIKQGQSFFTYRLTQEEKNIFFDHFFKNILKNTTDERRQYVYSMPGMAASAVILKKVILTISNLRAVPFTDEENSIIKRFAFVFEQSYTRFLDLKNAEAQAREAQIEAALEKVRSRSLAMHQSNELEEVIMVISEQLQHLQFRFHNASFVRYNDELGLNFWLATPAQPHPYLIEVPYLNNPVFDRPLEAIKKGVDFIADVLTAEEDRAWLQHLLEHSVLKNIPDVDKKFLLDTTGYARSIVITKHIMLVIGNYAPVPYTDEQNAILKRFGNVFEQAYTRFLDLQKAEAAAREARVEASLERVRSKTMAMHSSEDVADTVATMFDQLVKLGIETLRCGIGIMQEPVQMEVWTAKPGVTGKPELVTGRLDMRLHPLLQDGYNEWKNGKDIFSYELKDDDLKNYFTAINKHPDYPIKYELASLPTRIFHYEFNFPEGSLFVFSSQRLTTEASQIFKRFAGVFGQTYRRFLDLQKAEANAREATIEAALEKVRGKAMAMHNSNDLTATASLVFTELRKLGINPVRCGVSLQTKGSRKSLLYYAVPSEEGDNLSLAGTALLEGHPVLSQVYDSWIRNEDYFPVLTGELLTGYYQILKQKGFDVLVSPAEHKQYGYYLGFSEGMFYGWAEKPFTESEIKILKRFASVIDLTFRRYIELQKSEVNAKEAVKQAALDRVRAEIASMRTTTDLERITPLIWNELNILGLPFIRCGVFIMDESHQLIHTFLSTPDGKAIAAFHLPYATPGNTANIVSHWRDKKNYIDRWDRAAFAGIADTLVKQGAVPSAEQYLDTLPPGGFYLHFLPFLQGMLYVGNTSQLGEEEIKLIASVADAFSTAYARYEDFNKLEAAKQQVDNALKDLRSAQQQLIQSEKMASLGELTAGIAHEIQNPLNFVNNFSEVNKELIEEIKSHLASGETKLKTEEVDELLNDIAANEEKINHHGKRADAIVKSMLQHSRKNTGQKEATDINALCDEYLRLSYHGIRAKDKHFNAEMKTDFDESIGKINIIPQDIGRVLLNFFNNAFYAVNERSKAEGERQKALSPAPSTLSFKYEPTVSVQTKKLNDTVEIKVIDNGNGIPQNIVDKIFQPFFTTKPTGEGTGLGLSLAYDIIKAHGGEIKVETKEGEGSEFIILL